MPGPVRTAAEALRYWEQKQAAMANNLANVSTQGYKAETVFAELMQGKGPVGGGGTDYRAGARQETGRPMDVALEGDAFFLVRTPAGDRYTRNGSFSLDADGIVIDQAGNPVLGDNQQPLMLPPGEITIESNGEIRVDGASFGSLGIESVARGTRMTREGGNYFVPPANRVRPDENTVRVHQGQLEDSNVDPITSMVDMLDIQRNHAAVQRVLQTADGLDGRAVNDIARIA